MEAEIQKAIEELKHENKMLKIDALCSRKARCAHSALLNATIEARSTGGIQMQKKFKIIICLSLILMTMTSCDYFTEEQKTLIDYRYNSEWTEYYTMSDKQYTQHHPESFELLYLVTYADGHKERQWETCTRFEYQKAKEELGEVEP